MSNKTLGLLNKIACKAREEEFANLSLQEKKAKRQQFRSYNSYRRYYNPKYGKIISMSENKDCTLYLGVHIAERVLSHIFEDVVRMPNGTPGFDFICKKGFKIDVKSSCLSKKGYWQFNIKYNKIADYFLLLAFDNREYLNPEHIWLIKRSDLSNKGKILINNAEYSLLYYIKYEQIDKLEILKDCCNILR